MARPAAALSLAGLLLVGCGASPEPAGPEPAGAEPSASAATEPTAPAGMVVHRSDADVATTLARAEEAFDRAGMVVATVDHAAAGARADIEVDPTVVVIGGNPQAGTPVLQAAQTAGVDLPVKLLIWESDGVVRVGYNSAEHVGALAGLAPDDRVLEALRTGSAALAAAASGTEEPEATGGRSAVRPEGYLVSRPVDGDVAEVVERLQGAFEDAGLASPATVDHAANAASVGQDLRPTVVTFGGNSSVLPRLMAAEQTAGIDMPLRFLVWEDAGGVVRVGYPSIDVVAERHGLADEQDVAGVLDTIRDAERDLVVAAAGG